MAWKTLYHSHLLNLFLSSSYRLRWLQLGVAPRQWRISFLWQGQKYHWLLERELWGTNTSWSKTLAAQAAGAVTSPATIASSLWCLRLRWGQPRAARLSSLHWSAVNRNSSLAAVTEPQTAHIRLSLWFETLTLVPLSAGVLAPCNQLWSIK